MTWAELEGKIKSMTPTEKSKIVYVYPPSECPARIAVAVTGIGKQSVVDPDSGEPLLLTGKTPE